jgi:hypothetical protein
VERVGSARNLSLIAAAVPLFLTSASAAAAACSMAAGEEEADVARRDEEGGSLGDDESGGRSAWREEGEAEEEGLVGVLGEELVWGRGGRRPARVRES